MLTNGPMVSLGAGRHIGLNHFSRADNAIELLFRDKAELQRGSLEREVVVHRVVGNLGRLVAAW